MWVIAFPFRRVMAIVRALLAMLQAFPCGSSFPTVLRCLGVHFYCLRLIPQ
jgi:hypothetical protein